MKKLIALTLAVVCIFAFAGCGSTNAPEGGNAADGSTPAYASAEEVLTKVWGAYAEDEKFPAWGSNAETMVDGAPGAFDVSNTDELTASLVVPADLADNIDDAANLMHGMNLNMFTAAVFHVDDASAFIDPYIDNLKANQWMCGAPEKYVIIDAGDGYVVTAFGAADLMETFEVRAIDALEGSSMISTGSVVE
ncbi:MAG: hypothetical protein IJ471_08965 [Eubacterium sp.]|nr:hypothetical protein [Eubacterium sp.]